MTTRAGDHGRRGGHRVPPNQATATDRALSATPGLRGEPTDAERARTLLTHTTHAALSTVGTDPAGYPFGSMVGYAIDGAGRPVLCLSDLAEHSANLAIDPRASLLVTASVARGSDPLAGARATLVGDLCVVDGGERDAAHRCYRDTHPGAFYSEFTDFRLYRLEIAAVRYVGGFGRMSWVDTQDYRGAEADPLHPHVEQIVTHMNDDHADALVYFAKVLGNRPDTGWARMVHVDRYGFDVLAAPTEPDPQHAVRIGFDRRTDTPDAVRAAMVALLEGVR